MLKNREISLHKDPTKFLEEGQFYLINKRNVHFYRSKSPEDKATIVDFIGKLI